MSHVVKLTLAAIFVVCLEVSGLAQLGVPPTPLNLNEDLSTLQTPAYANFADTRCDRDGTIYTRQESANGSWQVASLSPDGSVEATPLAAVPGFGDTHTFATATSNGGTVEEIVRAQDTSGGSDSPSIYYLQFGADGSFQSRQEFAQEFIPVTLLPLPSGNFFAAGVVMKRSPAAGDVEEAPLAGIFDSDTHLISKLQRTSSSSDNSDTDTAMQQRGHVTLGDDGNMYVLLSASSLRVRVYRQTGELLREMTLQQPFEKGVAEGVWVSGGRVLVTYEGAGGSPKDAITYIEYDSGSGQLIRAYRPQFKGTVACFQDGQTLTVLVNQQNSGRLAIGSVDLQ